MLETIQGVNVGLYIHTQALDTTPAGRAVFGMLAVFSEFEREMIVARIKAGIARARAAGKWIGRARIDDKRTAAAKAMLKAGTGILKTAQLAGLGTSTVQRLKAEVARTSIVSGAAADFFEHGDALNVVAHPPLLAVIMQPIATVSV